MLLKAGFSNTWCICSSHFKKLNKCQAMQFMQKQMMPVSAQLKVAGRVWKACPWNHSKSLGYFLIALSCPASATLNASSGLFSIFKPSQQQGIVFPVNIAFWLFIYTLPNHITPWGRGSSCIASRSTVRQAWCPIPPWLPREAQTLYLGYVLLSTLCWLSCVCRQGGEGKGYKSHSTQQAGKQHSSL